MGEINIAEMYEKINEFVHEIVEFIKKTNEICKKYEINPYYEDSLAFNILRFLCHDWENKSNYQISDIFELTCADFMRLFDNFLSYGNRNNLVKYGKRYYRYLFIRYIKNAEKYKENPLSKEEISILGNEQFELVCKFHTIKNRIDEYFRTKIKKIINVIKE